MTNLKTTKRALLSSVVALLVCFTMLLGTTFAWFTDSVTSSGNIIQTGTLEIGMYWAEGNEDPASVTWTDASQGAIFNNTKWEPGYVEAKHIKIANEGTLALKYMLRIVPNGEVEALADVIDVYYVENATQITDRNMLAGLTPVGTLRDMIEDTDGAVHGALLPVGETATDTYERVGEVTATIVFKMRTEAGNEYKGMSIGTDFSIQLLATQYTFEEDSFDKQYDKDATYPAKLVYISDITSLSDALNDKNHAVLADDIATDTNVAMSGGILDGNGNSLSSTIDAKGVVDVEGGTVQNIEIVGIEETKSVGRVTVTTVPDTGIITEDDGTLTADLVLDNVTTANTRYAVSVDASGNSVYVKNSKLANNVDIRNQEEAIFENCYFFTDDGANELGTAWIGLGGDMTFINCHFEETIDFYESLYGCTGTITFINCTYGNNGNENRPFEATADFFTYWMEYSVSGYNGTFGEGDPGRTNFTCIVNDTVVWEETN